ncbi:MAG TPA: acetate kinase [Ardenticatenaceae bacterium]
MIILVLNCGSSSIKFQVIETESQQRLIGGLLGEMASESATFSWQKGNQRHSDQCGPTDYERGITLILETITRGPGQVIEDLAQIEGIGHRVVHGGEAFAESTLVTPEVFAAIEATIPLAPLHNPANLQGIATCGALLPGTPQVAVFDTAFHQTLPEHAYLYAIPYELYQQHGIRRYGFHGTSHRYVSERATGLLPGARNLITLHLGNGASITAIRDGKSVDTSMGLTPLEGLVMGTRSGDVDPSLIPFISQRENLSCQETETLLNKKSGLLGLSGGVSDMQALLARAAEGDERSQRALDVFCYRARKYIGSYMAALGQVDAIIFTGGIGENAAPVREQICAGLEPLGIEMDPEANRRGKEKTFVSTPDSRVKVLVIPTNEEWMIAQDTYEIISRS